MNRYYDQISPELKAYFNLLAPEFPAWLNEYIDTKELLSQQYISTTCGTIYSTLFPGKFFFSSLDHSVAVALIIWRFTHDRRQTLAGLFHDIATPVFKHCVDFMNGDYLTQESTEDLTTAMITNSPAIMALLQRDKIKVAEVDNYHLYPIADNDTPQLSADRLEYSLSNALFSYHLLNLTQVKTIYEDLTVVLRETGEPELSFRTKKIARDFVKVTSRLSLYYRDDKTRYSMQFLADLLKRLLADHKLTVDDLYHLKESEVIAMITASPYRDIFRLWQTAKKVKVSRVAPAKVYYVHQASKVRYIDPLVNGVRISQCDPAARRLIAKNLAYRMDNYVYLDFAFPD